MLLNTIRSRRAIYPDAYSDEPVTREEIEAILEAANWAPTHRRTEPWRFKVFHTETARKELSAFLGEAYEKSVEKVSAFKQKKMEHKALQSGGVIAICMQRDPEGRLPEWEEIAATAMAVQNMWLMAHDMGIGGYWSSPALIRYFGDYFRLADGERCLGFFYMGKYDVEAPEGIRKTTMSDKIEWM